MSNLPAWLYRGEDSALFETQEDLDAALAEGWVDSPAKAAPVDELTALREQAAKAGIWFDKRWGAARLKQEIEKHVNGE